jgi:hypothetical protein
MIDKINFIKRFISNLYRSIEPFTPLLKLRADQTSGGVQNNKKVLDNIKSYLSLSPLIVPPQARVPFRLYLSADQKLIRSALIQEQDGADRVIFYLSR